MIIATANFTRPGLSLAQLASSVRSSKVGLAQVLVPALLSSIAVLLLLLSRGNPQLQAPRDGIFVSLRSFLPKHDRVDDSGRPSLAILSWTSTPSRGAMP
jgi:hypothetical protein